MKFRIKTKFIHFLFGVIFILLIIFPVKEQKALNGNIDTTNLNHLVGITNKRTMEVIFPCENETINGLDLYFFGGKASGQVQYTVTDNKKTVLAEGVWQTKDLISNNEEELRAVSIDFEKSYKIEKEITVVLKGSEIEHQTIVGLYGNTNPEAGVTVKSGIVYENMVPLYQLKTEGKSYSWAWDALVLWTIFGAVESIIKKEKEKKNESVIDNNTSI